MNYTNKLNGTCTNVAYNAKNYITGPFEKFVDWQRCAAVMQVEVVTYAKL